MPCEIFIYLKAAGHWEAAQDFNGLIAVSCTFPSLLFITDDNCGFMSEGLGRVSLRISSPHAITAPGYLWVCPWSLPPVKIIHKSLISSWELLQDDVGPFLTLRHKGRREKRFGHPWNNPWNCWGETRMDRMHGKNQGWTGKQAHFGHSGALWWCHRAALVQNRAQLDLLSLADKYTICSTLILILK